MICCRSYKPAINTLSDTPMSIRNKFTRPQALARLFGWDHQFLADTGSHISVLPANWIPKDWIVKLRPMKSEVTNFDGSTVQQFIGWLPQVPITYNGNIAKLDFIITQSEQAILGVDAINLLGIKLQTPEWRNSQDSTIKCCGLDDRKEQQLKEARLELLPSAPAVISQPLRRIPIAVQPQVEQEIERMEECGIIQKVEASPFISPLVAVKKKDGKIRLCVDYRHINKFIIPHSFPVPTADELFSRVAKSSWFSRIDLKEAFYQIKLEDKSKPLTTFISSKGLFQFNVLPFGLASAPAIFNDLMQNLLAQCSNVIVYFDDVLVHAATKTVHDRALAAIQSILRQSNFQINENKSVYSVRQLEFLGRSISSKGISPSDHALAAVRECAQPTTKGEVRSFLGLVSFYRSFVPNFASISAPLYELLKFESKFHFGTEQEQAFHALISAVCDSLPVGCYDPSPEIRTVLTTDASGKGLGAVLSQVQDGKETPIYFISRKLQGAETGYSSSELETLAIVWAVERLHMYLYGRPFEIHTDHKALKHVLMGSMRNSIAPARIVRWAIRLMPYNFTTKYVRGCENSVADCLSRLPDGKTVPPTELDVSIASLQGEALQSLTEKELQECTAKELNQVLECIQKGWPRSANLCKGIIKDYFAIRHELCVVENLIFRGERIVVPPSLRHRLLGFAHEGHFGMSKTKTRLRSNYWWPSLNSDVEERVRSCHCSVKPIRYAPVQCPPWPQNPWSHVAIDIAGPKFGKNNKSFYIVVLIDWHSKWVCADVVRSVKTDDIIQFMMSAFTFFGLPTELTSDNGTQFVSSEFQQFLAVHRIKHIRSSIYNPEANGMVERVNRNLKKLITNSPGSIEQISESIREYVWHYNYTEHSSTGVTPATLLLAYKPRSRLDVVDRTTPLPNKPVNLPEIAARVHNHQRASAEYMDSRKRPANRFSFKPGDMVRASHGPVRQILRRTGPFSYQLHDGYSANARRLRHVKPEEQEYAPVPTADVPPPPEPIQRPARQRLPVPRYGFS